MKNGIQITPTFESKYSTVFEVILFGFLQQKSKSNERMNNMTYHNTINDSQYKRAAEEQYYYEKENARSRSRSPINYNNGDTRKVQYQSRFGITGGSSSTAYGTSYTRT